MIEPNKDKTHQSEKVEDKNDDKEVDSIIFDQAPLVDNEKKIVNKKISKELEAMNEGIEKEKEEELYDVPEHW